MILVACFGNTPRLVFFFSGASVGESRSRQGKGIGTGTAISNGEPALMELVGVVGDDTATAAVGVVVKEGVENCVAGICVNTNDCGVEEMTTEGACCCWTNELVATCCWTGVVITLQLGGVAMATEHGFAEGVKYVTCCCSVSCCCACCCCWMNSCCGGDVGSCCTACVIPPSIGVVNDVDDSGLLRRLSLCILPFRQAI